MKIDDLRKLVKEQLQSVLSERAESQKNRLDERQKVKTVLKKIVSEVLEKRKKEFEKTCVEICEELENVVKKINKCYGVSKNDAGDFEMCGCEPHHVFIRPRWNNNFEVLAYKDNTDRTKKIGLSYEDVVEFMKEYLGSEDANYVDKAYNKSAENSVDKEKKKNQGDGPQETDSKVEDAVEKTEDLPDQPMQDVNLKNVEKQSDHSVKGEKAKYKYPKQSDDELTVKFK